MRRSRLVIALALVALALTLAACGGGDDKEATTNPGPRDGAEAPDTTTPPSAPGGLPPALVECYAKRGYEIESPADIHAAPPEVVQECFGALHQGGGAP